MSEKTRSLVVFYSFEGNTRYIAEQISTETGAMIVELKPKNGIKTHGFLKYVWGGRQAVMKQKPDLEPFTVNPDEFDVIFLGTPVWAFTFAPPIRTFLSEIHLSGKKIALFCCDEGGLGKTFIHLRESLQDNEVIGELELEAPLRKNSAESAQKAKEWAKQMTEAK